MDRALLALDLLSRRPDMRLSDVRDHLSVGQSTAHRLMAMLVYRGFAVQDPRSRRYRAGPALYRLGNAAAPAVDVKRHARPVLEWLTAQSGETAHVGVITGTHVQYVDAVESAEALKVSSRAGQLSPAHLSSLGKAMLATLEDAQVRGLFVESASNIAAAQRGMDVPKLRREIATTRARGWARNRDVTAGVWSVGVAVVHTDPDLLCALGVATPKARSGRSVEEQHVQLLLTAATHLRDAVGGQRG